MISCRGYGILKSSLTPPEIEKLRAELTVVIDKDSGKTLRLFQESPKKLYIPYAYGCNRFGAVVQEVSDTVKSKNIDAEFRGQLRPHQSAAVDKFMEKTHGILSVPCGGGKTVIALKIMSLVGRRTLIVLHKDFLIAQWRERILQFVPGLSIGIIKASKVDTVGRDVVLASLQSLSMKDYSDKGLEDEFNSFGLLIVDEVHRTGTEVFSRALKKTTMPYMLGLSATVDRKDGMERIFKWHLGEIIYEIDRRDIGEDTNKPEVQLVYFSDASEDYCREEVVCTGKLNHSLMINNVCSWKPRTDMLIDMLHDVLSHSMHSRRRGLVLCDRKHLLKEIHERLSATGKLSSGFYVGGMKDAALKASEDKDVILATFAFASEGFDVQGLDTLFLISPKSDVRQAVGRILRQEASQRRNVPMIYDVVDNFSVFLGQARKRKAFYKAQNYKIRISRVNGDDDDYLNSPSPGGSEDLFRHACFEDDEV